jgi:hypothetical protein
LSRQQIDHVPVTRVDTAVDEPDRLVGEVVAGLLLAVVHRRRELDHRPSHDVLEVTLDGAGGDRRPELLAVPLPKIADDRLAPVVVEVLAGGERPRGLPDLHDPEAALVATPQLALFALKDGRALDPRDGVEPPPG